MQPTVWWTACMGNDIQKRIELLANFLEREEEVERDETARGATRPRTPPCTKDEEEVFSLLKKAVVLVEEEARQRRLFLLIGSSAAALVLGVTVTLSLTQHEEAAPNLAQGPVPVEEPGPGENATYDGPAFGPGDGEPAVNFRLKGEHLDLPATGDGISVTVDGISVFLAVPRDVLFVRGDTNGDATVNLADPVFLLAHLFAGGEPPSCMKAADTNDDGGIDVADGVFLLNGLFAGGGGLPEPHGVCGFDPTTDDLTCEAPPFCGR